MSTVDVVADVKQGDCVVYTIGGVEYNATALGSAHIGYNHGVRMHIAFLNLIYLNEQGTPIKIFAAPLLGSEVDDEHLNASADDAVRRNPNYFTSNDEDKKALYDQAFGILKANPRTIGWRIGSVGDRPAPVVDEKRQYELSGKDGNAGDWTKTKGAGLTADTSSVESGQEYRHNQGSGSGPSSAITPVQIVDVPTQADADAVVAQAEAERVQRAKEAELAGIPSADPSAEDLYAVAAEQDAADATSATPTADETAVQTDTAEPTA